MTKDTKDTIYIDVDDEITTVIDKLQSSPKKIVALVLPKRAAVFQSVVNMKLLNRTAEQANKHVVLITSEAALLPLAGVAGLRVASTLQSKPAIPDLPQMADSLPGDDHDEDIPDKPLNKATAVGVLAGLTDDEAIEVDNSTTKEDSAVKTDKKAKKRSKKIKIPNFEKSRTKVMVGILALVALIGLWFVGFVVMPKATIVLKTDTANVDVELNFVADTQTTSLDAENAILPAQSKEFRKTDAEKVPATGEKDLGEKASGSVTLKLTNCSSSQVSIPAGTPVTAGNLSFSTSESATLQSIEIGGDCRNDDFPNISSKPVAVTAINAGEKFNLSANQTFSVGGYSAVSGTNADAMSGGTSKIVKVITKEDIDKAKETIAKRAGTEAPQDLRDDLQKAGYMPLSETLSAGEPTVTTSKNAGDEAADVTVTSTTVFTMLGVKEDDLKQLVEAEANKRIDPEKQIIQDNGLAAASITVKQKSSGGRTMLSLATKVIAGPDIDEESIKQEVAGKKRGEVQSMLGQRPGIRSVEVSYSPFWVQSTPSNTSKITIVFEAAEEQATQNDGN
jgi:hypothetical protein